MPTTAGTAAGPTSAAAAAAAASAAAAAANQGDGTAAAVSVGGGAADETGRDGDQDPELIDEDMLDADIDKEVAASINKLPTADQARLKAALGARGGRRRRKEADDDGSDTATRERSPRPTKTGIAE